MITGYAGMNVGGATACVGGSTGAGAVADRRRFRPEGATSTTAPEKVGREYLPPAPGPGIAGRRRQLLATLP